MYKLKINTDKQDYIIDLNGKSHTAGKYNQIYIEPINSLQDGNLKKYEIILGCMGGMEKLAVIDVENINNSLRFNYDKNIKIEIIEEIKENNYFSKESKIINLTPHDVNIVNQEGENIKTYKSKGIVRVSTTSKLKSVIDDVNIYSTEYGEVEELPEEKEDTYYIVSMLIKQACSNRKDLLSPSQLVRDSEGKIIGCLGLE